MVSKLRGYTLSKSLRALAITAHICCFSASTGLLTPGVAYCGKVQNFDLNINELRSKTTPVTSESSSNKTTQKKRHVAKPEAPETTSSTVTVPSREKLLLLKSLPSPGSIPTPLPSSTITLQNSTPPCELVPKLLTMRPFLKSISTAEALHGVPLSAPYAVKGNAVLAVIACGLAEAEEITFTRLLAAHGTRLINIVGNDSPEAVVNKVIGTLDFSSQTLRTTPENVRMIYIFPAQDAKESGIFVSLKKETADIIK